jgi:hypothetical protein
MGERGRFVSALVGLFEIEESKLVDIKLWLIINFCGGFSNFCKNLFDVILLL